MKKLFESITGNDIEVGVTKEEDKLLVNAESETRPDWTLIGFQGLDPITDFRGGGLLSLVQLIYFAEVNEENIKNINERANHPTTVWAIPYSTLVERYTGSLIKDFRVMVWR